MAYDDIERMFDQVKSIQRAAGRLSVALTALEVRERDRAYAEAVRRGPTGSFDPATSEARVGEDKT